MNLITVNKLKLMGTGQKEGWNQLITICLQLNNAKLGCPALFNNVLFEEVKTGN